MPGLWRCREGGSPPRWHGGAIPTAVVMRRLALACGYPLGGWERQGVRLIDGKRNRRGKEGGGGY